MPASVFGGRHLVHFAAIVASHSCTANNRRINLSSFSSWRCNHIFIAVNNTFISQKSVQNGKYSLGCSSNIQFLVLSISYIQCYFQHGLEVLRKAGCLVTYNSNQTCCGQPAFNAGFGTNRKIFAQSSSKTSVDLIHSCARSAKLCWFCKNYYNTSFR